MSSATNFPEPGSEINTIHKNVSPAGLQARAAATQSQAPQGTHLSDPVQAASSPQHAQSSSGVNTLATDHDPTLNFSSPGMQARAAAAGQAPMGTVQPEYLSPDAAAGNASGAPAASPMGTAPDTIHPSQQTRPTHIPESAFQQPVENTPIDSLNTAREVFQPTSSNQPQAEFSQQPTEPPPAAAAAPQPAAPPAPAAAYYGPNSAANNSSFATPHHSPLGQVAQQAATQTASSAPEGTKYTGPNSSNTYIGPNSASQAGSSFPGHQSSAGAIARSAATQTPGSAPAGTHFTQPSPSNTFSGFQQTRSASNAPTQAASYPSQAPMRSSAGGAARAAAKGQHPPGTGPDAGIVAQATANFSGHAARVDTSHQFSSPGMQARAAATGQGPAGTASHFAARPHASQEANYEPPTTSRFNHSPQAAVSPGLQARAAAYGQHPAGTGPGSVKGMRSYSTMSRVGPAMLKTVRLLKK